MTPRRFFTTTGQPFPVTVLDDRDTEGDQLDPAAFAFVKQRAAAGEQLLSEHSGADAFLAFQDALDRLPEPRQRWNAAGWLLVAMGEAAIASRDFDAAFAPLQDAMLCPGTIGNPWVHLRLGQCRFELDDPRAADELTRAYMGGGREIFDGLDPKYFALLERVLRPPVGRDRL